MPRDLAVAVRAVENAAAPDDQDSRFIDRFGGARMLLPSIFPVTCSGSSVRSVGSLNRGVGRDHPGPTNKPLPRAGDARRGPAVVQISAF